MMSKLICGIIRSKSCEMNKVERELENNFGPIDYRSDEIPFNFTDYYEKEMGKNLIRQWLSFKKLIKEENIKFIKQKTIEIEKIFLKKTGARTVNIDPGYVSLSKLVLATTKDYSHRIYLGNGIYAEVTLIYKEKKFHPLDWTYPDYRDNVDFFYIVREKLKNELH